MTYIYDTGGFLPNKEHCLMIGGKLQDITHDDILSFAAECGIRSPESIVRKVAAAVSSFRELAQKNGVREQWIGRVENCLNNHLAAWHYAKKEQTFSFDAEGHTVTNAHIEEAYKGNYHLLANVDGRECKYILRSGKEEHLSISSKGLSNIPEEEIQALVAKYLLPKVGSNMWCG